MFDIQVPPSNDPTKNNNFLFVKETVCNRLPRECTAHEIESIPYKVQCIPKYLCTNIY